MGSTENKLTQLKALKELARRVNQNFARKTDVPVNVSELANDAKYQTEDEVAATINAKVSSAYKVGGSVAFANLPELTEANLGLVVNVTDKFTTTADFVEGAGGKHPAGTNVAVVLSNEEYKYDVLAGFVNLSGLVEKEDGKGLSQENYTTAEKEKLAGFEIATDEEVATALAEIYGEDAVDGDVTVSKTREFATAS